MNVDHRLKKKKRNPACPEAYLRATLCLIEGEVEDKSKVEPLPKVVSL